MYYHLRYLFVWISAAACFALSVGEIIRGPKVVCKLGEDATLPCHTSSQSPVVWQRVDNEQRVNIYAAKKIVSSASKFSVATPKSGDYNLTVSGCATSDEGSFVCVENNGTGNELYVYLQVVQVSASVEAKNSSVNASTTLIPEAEDGIKQYYWLIALGVFFALCIPLLIVCVVFGCRNAAERKKADDKERKEKLLE